MEVEVNLPPLTNWVHSIRCQNSVQVFLLVGVEQRAPFTCHSCPSIHTNPWVLFEYFFIYFFTSTRGEPELIRRFFLQI